MISYLGKECFLTGGNYFSLLFLKRIAHTNKKIDMSFLTLRKHYNNSMEKL